MYMHSAAISTGITCMSEKNFMLYVIQLAGGILLKKAKIFWSYIKHFCNLVSVTKCNEVFQGQRFETQIRIQTQIRLSRILTLAIKCFMITKITSMYTPQGLLEAPSLKLLCDVISLSWLGHSNIPSFTMAISHLHDYRRWLNF